MIACFESEVLEGVAQPLLKKVPVDGRIVITPEDVYGAVGEIRELAQECFVVLSLNSKNRLIRKHLIALGTVNRVLVQGRECFRPAILDGATAVILCHNHPSGSPAPSSEDVAVTRTLVRAGQSIGIPVLDHVIIGDTNLSMRESGFIEFDGQRVADESASRVVQASPPNRQAEEVRFDIELDQEIIGVLDRAAEMAGMSCEAVVAAIVKGVGQSAAVRKAEPRKTGVRYD